MRFLYLALVAAYSQFPLIYAQGAATTVVVFVTVPSPEPSPEPTSSRPAESTKDETPIIQPVPVSASSSKVDTPDIKPASVSSSSSTTVSATPSSSSEPASSLHEATSSQEYPQVTSAPDVDPEYYDPEMSNLSGSQVDNDGGASGSDAAAFKLSTGGLAAILIVVILVGLFGIASIILFIVAKRRQWTMRQTLTRASRRLTGRFARSKAPQTPTAANRRSRRTGIRMGSPPRPGVKAVYPPGHKRGLVVDVKDPEKGPQPLDGKAPKNTRPRENTWIQRMWGDGWK